MNLLGAAGLGLALGMVTGMPLGVINVAIVDAATTGRRRFAFGIGLGGAAADTVHAALAFAGIGHLVTARPDWVRVMAIAAAAVIAIYVVASWRAQRKHAAAGPAVDRGIARGIFAGVAITLPNPAALGAWVAVATAVWPDADTATSVIVATGVGLGSALWFGLFARWVARARGDHPLLRAIPRVALGVLLAMAVVGVVRVI